MPIRCVRTAKTLVIWWIGAPTGDDVRAVVAILQGFSRAGDAPHYISIVSADARPPDAEGRKAFLHEVDRVMGLCEHFHLVLEAGPFINAIARGLVAAASFVSRFRGRVTIYDNLEVAVTTVGTITGEGESLRTAMAAGPASSSS